MNLYILINMVLLPIVDAAYAKDYQDHKDSRILGFKDSSVLFYKLFRLISVSIILFQIFNSLEFLIISLDPLNP